VDERDDELLTTGDAATLLGVTRQHVINLTDQGVLPYSMTGTHRRVRRGDVVRLAGRAAADRGGPMTRDQIRSLWLHRVAAGHVARAPEASLLRARKRLRILLRGSVAGEAWLRQWQDIIDTGPEAVMRAMTATGPQARELRQNSPFLGLLSAAERTATLAAFERTYPPSRRSAEAPAP
jgi:excisionase family DNA binding protein